jgi:uncharacterized membrane protein YfcA
VLLVPALVFLAQIPIEISIAAAMAAYVLSGTVGIIVFANKGSIRWDKATWLCAGAAPTAYAGAWAVAAVRPVILQAGLGLLTLFSGLNSLRTVSAGGAPEPPISNIVLLIVGAGTGLLSSVSGTGGPLVLVPLLLALNAPVLTAVGLSQAIQLSISIAATMENVVYGHLDWLLSGLLAASLTVGTWFGARFAHFVSRMLLQCIVSIVLISVGAFILANIGLHLTK